MGFIRLISPEGGKATYMVKDFLESLASPKTRKSHAHGFLFCHGNRTLFYNFFLTNLIWIAPTDVLRGPRRKEMKRILSSMTIILLCTSMFSIFVPHVNAQETIIFQDDFESYTVGSFPSAGGWEIIWNGAGNQYQVITSSYYASPIRSLQLMGSYGWSVVVKKDFSSSSNLIGYETRLMASEGGGGSVAFCNIPIETWGRYYAMVGFGTDGIIWACSRNNEEYQQLQPFTPYTWYKIRVLIDRSARVYNVWIDDVLKGQDIPIYYDPWEILSLQFQVGWVSIKNYFDDVKVFEVSGTPPKYFLVGYWKFDEGSGDTAADSSGNGNTGTLINGPVWVDGKQEKALSFDGVDDHVQVPQSSSLDVTDQITVETWVYPRAYVDNTGMVSHIISRCDYSGGHIYVLSTYPDSNKISFSINPHPDEHPSVADLPLNAWTHLAMTYDGFYVRLYINGEFDSSYAQSGPIYTTSNWLAFGCKPTGPWGGAGTYAYFNGVVDDVRIYNRALSQQEIQADMGEPSPPPSVKKYLVTLVRDVNARELMNPSEIERGATVYIYFQVKAWDGASTYTPTNGVPVDVVSSLYFEQFTSKKLNGWDGIVQAGPYDTSSYSGPELMVKVVDGVFNGVPVEYYDWEPLVYQIQPRKSTAGVGFDLSASAALGIGVEGALQNAFLIENDGANALDVIISRNMKMGITASLPIVPGFAITIGGFSAEYGVDPSFGAGLMGGGDCRYPNPSDSTQASLIRYLVTLEMLDYTEAYIAGSGDLSLIVAHATIDRLRSAIAEKISELGVNSYYSPLHAGGWAKVNLNVGDGKLKCTVPLLMIGGKPVSFEFDANPLTSNLIPSGAGSVAVELSGELKQYKDVIGISLCASFEEFASFDFGFDSFIGTGIKGELALELKFDSSTLNLKSIVLELSLEGTKELLEVCEFGGLLKTAEMGIITLAPSRTYKVTATLEAPVTNAGALYDYLEARGLLTLNMGWGLINFLELASKTADSIKDGLCAEYNVTIEQKDTAKFPFKISVDIPELAEFELGFDFEYLQTQSHLAENGHVTYMNGELGIWPALSYMQPPQDFSVQNFILNSFLDLNSLTGSLGTVVQMQEKQSKLYLHVYDLKGNHVGFNFQQNTTDMAIPNAGYYDYLNGRIDIVLPGDLDRFIIAIDGSHAHEAYENFSLGIYRFGSSTAYVFVDGTIANGQTLDYRVYVGSSGVPIIDNTPPATGIVFGEPSIKVGGQVFLTASTPISLTATDNLEGSGVSLTSYKICNATYYSGWLTYTKPFNLSLLTDGTYIIAFNSTDNAGNVEPTNTIQVTLFSWTYVFTDSYGRGTTLKINIAHKFFQFITPDRDYGIRNATYMRLYKRAIIICHKDNELKLATVSVDTKLDFCIAYAKDIQTGKEYWLIDKIGTEN